MTIDLPELPAPICTYADHSYPAFTKQQMVEYAKAAVIAALAEAGRSGEKAEQTAHPADQIDSIREALESLRACRSDLSRAASDALKRLEASLSPRTYQ